MLDILLERFRQKERTVPYPKKIPVLPPRFRGRPFIFADRCRASGCDACAKVCPVQAIQIESQGAALDMRICTFCGLCADACPKQALVFSNDWRLASTEAEALVIRPAERTDAAEGPVVQSYPPTPEPVYLHLPELPVTPFEGGSFSRSFRLRQVSAAGCGACEADLNVLGTIVFDLGRFGMDFVASPRHADALVVTGPVPRNMRTAFEKCERAAAKPCAVIAVGACAASGGLFRALSGSDGGQGAEGIPAPFKADLYIPGCPPHPYTNLDGLLRFLGRKTPFVA